MLATAPTAPTITESLTLEVRQEIQVQASLEATFASLLEQLGPGGTTPDGAPLNMKLEAWPGGRWFRDLGGNDGHLWGHVQSIKAPELLELTGPLFMSYAAVSNVQYRLSVVEGGTLIQFHHLGFGMFSDAHRQGVNRGWSFMLQAIASRAEAAAR